jgi:hypothetical protein
MTRRSLLAFVGGKTYAYEGVPGATLSFFPCG